MNLKISEGARKKVLELRSAEKGQGLALRVGIQGRGPGGFEYFMRFAPADDRKPDDTVVDAEGFELLVDAASRENLDGTTIDFVDGPQGSGFKIDNPNPVWRDPKALAVQRVLDSEINPAVAQHGGFVTLLDVKDDVVYIQLGGGCQGCGMVDVTLKQGIEVRIREAVPEIREIVDTTDHAGGTNPFYRPSKGGASPYG